MPSEFTLGYNVWPLGVLDSMDSFTIAVLVGGGIVVGVLGLMILLDKGKPATVPGAASPAAKGSSKR
jgi:hypothetical protein